MKKAKKALLSLTLAFAVSSVAVACANQGAVDDRTYRGAGQYQGRGTVNNYTIDSYDMNDRNNTGLFGRDGQNRGARGLFTTPNANDGYRNNNTAPGGGLFFGGNGYRMGNDGNNGMFGRDNNGMFNGGNAGMNGNNEQRARQIEQSLAAIPGVQDCQVVMNGNEVVAGVNTEDGQQKSEVMNQVRQQLQNLAPNQDCYVTTDQNIINRLQNLDGLLQNNDGNAGRQFRQFVDDAGNKIQKITR